MKLKIRCSSLPIVFNCPGSMTLPRYDEGTTYAEEGKTQHKLAQDDLMGVHQDVRVDYNDNTRCYVEFIRTASVGGQFYVEEELSHEYSNFTLVGHVDAYIEHAKGDTISLIDLKNGYEGVDPFSYQMLGYGLLLKHRYGDRITGVNSIIVQDSKYKKAFLSTNMLVAFEKRLLARVATDTFRMGGHCQFCDSRLFCNKMIDTIENISRPQQENDAILLEALRAKSHIVKTLKHAQSYLEAKYPDKFEKKTRKLKVWIDPDKAPRQYKPMTPAAVYNLGSRYARYKGNIREIYKVSHVVKENNK